MKYPIVFFDTETGGLDPKKNPILSLGLVTLGLDNTLVHQMEIPIEPPLGCEINPIALQKNGIDLGQHLSNPKLRTQEEASQLFTRYYEKTKEHFGVKEVKFGGHNIRFDLDMVNEQFYLGKWPKAFPRFGHCIDTMNLVASLRSVGRIDIKSLTLDDAIKFYKIETEGSHQALNDAISSARLFSKIMKLEG